MRLEYVMSSFYRGIIHTGKSRSARIFLVMSEKSSNFGLSMIKKDIAPRQGYRGWADMESVEYKYPRKEAVKYVLRISLVGSSPGVWREVAVPSTIKLTSLAHVIVLAMGWEESHLSMFKKWRKEYHVYMDGAEMYDYPIEDAGEYALCDLLSAGDERYFPGIDTAIAVEEGNK